MADDKSIKMDDDSLSGAWIGNYFQLPMEIHLRVKDGFVIGRGYILCENEIFFDITGLLQIGGELSLELFHRKSRGVSSGSRVQKIVCYATFDSVNHGIKISGLCHKPSSNNRCSNHTEKDCQRTINWWRVVDPDQDLQPYDIFRKTRNNSTGARSELSKASEAPFLYDVAILLGNGEELPSFKIILAVKSDYFMALFRQNPEKAQVDLTAFDPEITKAAITYMFTGEDFELLHDPEVLPELLQFSSYVQCETLSTRVVDQMCVDINRKTCIPFLTSAIDENKDELKSRCLKFFEEILLANPKQIAELSTSVLRDVFSMSGIFLRDKYGRLYDEPREIAEAKLLKYLCEIRPPRSSDFARLLSSCFNKKDLLTFANLQKANPRLYEDTDTTRSLIETLSPLLLEVSDSPFRRPRIQRLPQSEVTLNSDPDEAENGHGGTRWRSHFGQLTIRKVRAALLQNVDTMTRIKAMEITNDDGSKTCFGSFDIGNYEMIGGHIIFEEIEVPANEHIALVRFKNREQRFLEKILFITNTGRKLRFKSVEEDGDEAEIVSTGDIPKTVGIDQLYLEGISANHSNAGLSGLKIIYACSHIPRDGPAKMEAARRLASSWDSHLEFRGNLVHVPDQVRDGNANGNIVDVHDLQAHQGLLALENLDQAEQDALQIEMALQNLNL